MKGLSLLLSGCLLLTGGAVLADGKVSKPRSYQGSLEEQAQEAILIYTPGEDDQKPATEDLILKIAVKGKVDSFAWVIPFPTEPETVEKEDARLFAELFRYVESRRPEKKGGLSKGFKDKGKSDEREARPVEVLSRKTVGSYDVAIVRENKAGALNEWLKQEDYQPLPEDAEDVLGFYREKKYVFACVKVTKAEPDERSYSELHPLRFTFQTGREEGIYFPMKMTGLQSDPFDVTLYVFHRWWIDDRQTEQGYKHRGFRLDYRDWDTPRCEANAGKTYSDPESDPFLSSRTDYLPTVTRLFQKLHPGKRYYLTKIGGHFQPADVRQWEDDLWLETYRSRTAGNVRSWVWGGVLALAGVTVLAAAGYWWLRRVRPVMPAEPAAG
jgi:hypothetical protein